jgi:hypothetical protein
VSDPLKAKGMNGMAVVGAAMHKLATLIYGVLKSQKPYDASMHVREDVAAA